MIVPQVRHCRERLVQKKHFKYVNRTGEPIHEMIPGLMPEDVLKLGRSPVIMEQKNAGYQLVKKPVRYFQGTRIYIFQRMRDHERENRSEKAGRR